MLDTLSRALGTNFLSHSIPMLNGCYLKILSIQGCKYGTRFANQKWVTLIFTNVSILVQSSSFVYCFVSEVQHW